VLGRLRLRRAREEVGVYFARLGGAPVYIFVREPDQAGLSFGARLVAELMQEVFRGEALRDLEALVIFDASANGRALLEAAREWCEWRAYSALRSALSLLRELRERYKLSPADPLLCGRYSGGGRGPGAAAVGAHPRAGFGEWLEACAHELIHHAMRHPSFPENARLLAEALLESVPSLRGRYSAGELAWKCGSFFDEYAAEYIALNYFALANREPRPLVHLPKHLEELGLHCSVEGWSAVREALKGGGDEPLRRAAHALFLQWIQRFPADAYADRLERLAEEAVRRLRRLAEKPEPDALFEWAHALARLELVE
jgi:hypothetical protein